ncbi:putative integral membrane protein [Alloactinosynnema sp. L-07]|uniref:type II secretion system F family protein n=1 Tax=Alloactinosynnema sp. L-07 TaxID=1653480 RepID=UPI00065EFD52|nr:type II secretion system F family protein [Alloactinosynnema sp. L-07]CRK57643.1 putative integral membrane protein [Alloactinosynnema sp. L-07]
MNPALLSAVLGGGVGIGVLLIVAGWRGKTKVRLPQTSRQVRVRSAVTAGIGALTWLVTGWVVAGVLAAAAMCALPEILGPDRRHQRRMGRVEGIASWTEMLRDTMSAAAGMEQAILATAPLAPAAIRVEVTALAARIQAGDRLPDALRRMADELADPAADLVVAALVLASQRQARQLADLLGSLAGAAREQAAMRLRVHADRARTRTSVRVIIGTTIVFAVALVLLNRPYLSAYDTATGQLVLASVGLLFAAGVAWLAKIAATAEPSRVLVPSTTSGRVTDKTVTS